ncbi:Protein O-mannosyl-transferase TMTC3 [Lamellibrachia satsuma]|nr:Protein O-mannosyl-transferase TMTC3 [Lamellibrachia satsuma]
MSAIVSNKDLRPETPVRNLFRNDFWGTPMAKEKSHKSYRPLCVLTFRLNYILGGLEPLGYHLLNALLHAAVCALFYRMSKMFLSRFASFVAAVLFAVHPVHTEAVTGVVGRAELLSSLCYLAALMTYAKCTGSKTKTVWRHLLMTIVLVAIAMLCKEQGITVVGVCCVYEVFVAKKMSVQEILRIAGTFLRGKPYFPEWLQGAVMRTIVLTGGTLLLLMARIRVMGAQLPVFTRFDNPASEAPAPTRQLTFNYLLPVNAWLLLCPDRLCCDWTMGTIPLLDSWMDARNLATLCFYASLVKFVHYSVTRSGQRVRAVIMSLAMMVFPFIPALNLFFPVGFVVAERVLYLPSMGFCMLMALGFELLLSKQALRHVLWLGMGLFLLTHSLKTISRNKDWKSEYTIFQAALRVNQRNAKLFNNVGHALENNHSYNTALAYFQNAVRVQPNDIGAHINVGRTLKNLERFEEAEVAYRKALALFPPIKPGQTYTARIAPNHLMVYINLGNLITRNPSRLLEADALLRAAIGMRADFTQAYINRGDILMKLGRVKEALEQYKTALRYEPDDPDIYYNLGVVLIEEKKYSEALRHFEEALKLNPTHKQTLFNSAVLMQEVGDPRLRPEANRRLHKLLEQEPNNEKIYFNLGMLSMDEHDFKAALKWFDKATQLKDDFRSALFNVALMLTNDLKKPLDALPYLHKLLKHYPNHTKGLILMGDINMNSLNDINAAEQNFLKILDTEPRNVQANHNLCVVYVERGDLHRAEKCLSETLQLAPQEDYIKQHLGIVRNKIRLAEQAGRRQEQTRQHTQP